MPCDSHRLEKRGLDSVFASHRGCINPEHPRKPKATGGALATARDAAKHRALYYVFAKHGGKQFRWKQRPHDLPDCVLASPPVSEVKGIASHMHIERGWTDPSVPHASERLPVRCWRALLPVTSGSSGGLNMLLPKNSVLPIQSRRLRSRWLQDLVNRQVNVVQ